jgi:hypothetical protein
MDILLLSITVVSLVIAFVMSAVVWRLSAENRARSAARIAALASAAQDHTPASDTVVNAPAPVAPRIVAAAPAPPAAAGPAAVAPAVAAPAAAVDSPWLAPTGRTRVVTASRPAVHQEEFQFGESFLGSAVAAPPSSGRQRGLAIAASLLFVVLVTGGYFTVFGTDGTEQTTVSAAGATAPAPLELISLRHERKQGALAITGLVRNPGAGQLLDKLAAVVFLFDQHGAFLTSARAGVDYTQLAPGDESPFVIRVDAPSSVARYRVSFRTEAGVVPHVDRRGQEPIARDLP